MPMLPGPLAVITYAAVKVLGYAAFARGLNTVSGKSVPLFKFGISKTAIGLAAGLAYLFLVIPNVGIDTRTSSDVLLYAIPVRLLAWSIALWIFYDLQSRPIILAAAVLAGTAWSYALDGIMALLYRLPGMIMPFC